jgi:transglutaminase-like putative cysteine protease
VDHAKGEAEAMLSVEHETRYDYAQPVLQAHHLAHLEPLADEYQAVDEFDLEIEPAPGPVHSSIDTFGNRCHHFSCALPHGALTVRSRSRVRLKPRFDGLDPTASPSWESRRDRMRYVARGAPDAAAEFVQPSPYVPRLDPLRAYVAPHFPRGAPLVPCVLSLLHALHADFTYRGHSTEVDTPLAQVFEQRAGVCQDFAHVMIGALRMMGLPARYVSGYLRTHTAGDGPALVGADASHAWLQVHVPGAAGVPADGWLDLDPTNDAVPGVDHVRVAVGRDYGDVVPVRGVILGGGQHALTVRVTTRRTEIEPRPGPVVA